MDTFFGSDIVVPFSRVPRYRLEAGGSVVCVETVQRLATLCRGCGNSAETGNPVSWVWKQCRDRQPCVVGVETVQRLSLIHI